MHEHNTEYKLIICVYACDKIDKYIREINTINETWGKLCRNEIKLLFFLGEEVNPSFVGPNYINLPTVKDDYLSASYKQFLGLKYIYENYNPEFVICCGTDTYLNIPKLYSYINIFNPGHCSYIGGHGCRRQIGDKNYYFHAGGPGFIITYNCLQKIYPQLNELMSDWINICIQNNIQHLIPACDVAVSYYVQQENIKATIIYADDLTFLTCNYLGYPCHLHKVNIQSIIACHNMSIDDFYNYTQILQENNYFT